MSFIQAVVLGIIEGFTEFLPISSTAHLLLASKLLGIEETEFVKTFVIVIQLGAILAVAGLYFRRLFTDWKTNSRILAAFLPTAVIGYGLYSIVKRVLFEETYLILGTLFFGGILIILFEKMHRETAEAVQETKDISYLQAVLIGLSQAVAVVPGVSRAAATIVGGELAGVSRRAIVEFSFLLAIPTMLSASAYDLLKSAPAFAPQDLSVLAVGFLVSAGAAVLSVRWLLSYVSKHSFTAFGAYRMVLAVLLALIFWI